MREDPKPGEFYRHFKDKMYQIIAVAVHSETKEKLVIYQALYGEYGVYARPLDMFMSEVDKAKYPDAVQKYRFEKIENIGELSKNSSSSNCENEESLYTDEKNISDKVLKDNIQSDKAPNLGKNYFMEFLEADSFSDKKEIILANREFISDRELDTMYEIYGLKRQNIDKDIDIADLIGYLDMQQQYEGKRLRK
ncbi:DUF1653 domain-containing protein [Lachnoanaerobaculum saburreum]|uniref:DUF1653 domain-containing protein n=1 Tax=Lachnoanaerobaculum saburreum DSM 3986 TaxID=887325 RepID=E6LPB0_9FIRM|nr:DUF1653 domain-containing protein [Lachnoanaerobaculum saburreum]EFU76305.1 hypothetical protein HMPREF0381_1795 [Lachnoanaerobaculum saburreum DSM 3986]